MYRMTVAIRRIKFLKSESPMSASPQVETQLSDLFFRDPKGEKEGNLKTAVRSFRTSDDYACSLQLQISKKLCIFI